MLAPQPKSAPLTVDEYLLREEKSEVRHEFYNGEVYAMAGGTVNHNLLIDNVKDILKKQLRPRGCRVYSENIKVGVSRGVYLPYADLVATCHPFDQQPDQYIVRQPRLLVEVLSKSTARLNCELSVGAIYDDIELIPDDELPTDERP